MSQGQQAESGLPGLGFDAPIDMKLGYIDTEELKRARAEGKRIALDWKGDPMIINPGDNMPMF